MDLSRHTTIDEILTYDEFYDALSSSRLIDLELRCVKPVPALSSFFFGLKHSSVRSINICSCMQLEIVALREQQITENRRLFTRGLIPRHIAESAPRYDGPNRVQVIVSNICQGDNSSYSYWV